jgi:peptide/nickel transport system substrate-binding protein
MGLLKSKIYPLFSRVRNFFADLLSFITGFFGKNKNRRLIDNADLDKKLVYSLSKSKIPNLNQLKYLGKVLNKKELRLINILTVVIIINLGWLCFNGAVKHLRVVPVFGGQYTEGLVGTPAHINPLYASLSDVDSDIAHLIYSSLFKYNGNGQLENDLAESYSVSADGKVYTIKLRNDAYWPDGSKVTSADVAFTFSDIVNSAYNSSLRYNFSGVRIEASDEQTVVFTLSNSYSPFLGLLTFGVMPQYVWGEVSPESALLAETNLKPVGSGPYEFKSLVKDKTGSIKSYTLTVNKDYYGKKPYIKEIVFKFYSSSAEALAGLNDNNVDGLSTIASADKDNLIARNSLNFYQINLPRIKAIFFNQSKNAALKDVKVRQALSYATPKQQIIDRADGGNAHIANGPILDNNYAYNPDIEKYDFDSARASSMLASAGWKQLILTADDISALNAKSASSTLTAEENTELALGPGTWLYTEQSSSKKSSGTKTVSAKSFLVINLSIIDDDENNQIAQVIKDSWEKIGVKTVINPISLREIQSVAVKPKDYEALLFSEQVGNDPDVYAFWHSTQATSGGLNLSNYKNEDADKDLEDGRLSADQNQRVADYRQFQSLVANDAPAVFLFSPYYTYVQNKKIKGFAVKSIAQPFDRFANIADWYIKTNEKLEW